MGWLSGWAYRRPVRIDNTGNPSNLTNYQVLVTVDTAFLIAQGKMRPDCGDIRFTDVDGVTLLSYWIESGINTNSTKIWVKVPAIPASSIYTIYMYYGNPDAVSMSDPDSVFIFFDDFEKDRGWQFSANGPFSGGYTTSDYVSPTHSYVINYPWSTGSSAGYYGRITKTITLQGDQVIVELKVKDDYTGTSSGFHFKQVYLAGTLLWEDDVAGDEGGWVSVAVTSTPPAGSQDLILQVYDKKAVANFGINVWWDDVRIRKYVSPEPTTTVDPEEVAPAPAVFTPIDELKKRLIFTTTPSFLQLSGSGSVNILSPSAGTKTLTVRNWWLITNATDGRITLASPSKLFGSLLAKKQKKTGQEDTWATLGMGEPILLYYQNITPDSKVLVLVSWRED